MWSKVYEALSYDRVRGCALGQCCGSPTKTAGIDLRIVDGGWSVPNKPTVPNNKVNIGIGTDLRKVDGVPFE